MTGIGNDIGNLFSAGAGTEYSAPIGPTVSGAPLPSTVSPMAALSSKLNLASMSASLFSGGANAYGAISAANQRASADTFQSQDQLLQAKQATIAGQQASNQILDNMVQTVAGQRLAFSGNGVDLNFGTPLALESNTRKLANTQVSISNSNAALAAVQRRKQSAALLEQAANTRSSGYMAGMADVAGGAENALDTYAKQQQRVVIRG